MEIEEVLSEEESMDEMTIAGNGQDGPTDGDKDEISNGQRNFATNEPNTPIIEQKKGGKR